MFWTLATIVTALLAGLFGWSQGGHSLALVFTLLGALSVFAIHDLKKHKHALASGSLIAGLVAGYYIGLPAAVLAALLAFLVQLAVFEFSLKRSVLLPLALTGTIVAWFCGWHYFNPMTGLIFGLIAFLALVGIDDYYLQRKHAIRRNFPVLGWCRYGFELIGDELRQYWFMSDTEERPYDRETRRFMYRAGKGVNYNLGFGSSRDQRAVGAVHLLNEMFPVSEKKDRGNRLPPLVIGKNRRKPYHCAWPINISGMSWGALSAEAVAALSSGAKLANVHMLTGEGGLTPYHLNGVTKRVTIDQVFHYYKALIGWNLGLRRGVRPVKPEPVVVGGGRIVMQIGPAKFGFRKSLKDCLRIVGVNTGEFDMDDLRRVAEKFYLNGLDNEMLLDQARKDELVGLDFDKVRKLAEDDQIVMFEIKLAQGAKPGQGGKLPKEKITPELADFRQIPMGKDCYSPNAWDEFCDVPSMFKFVKALQDLTGKPVGIKIVVGQDRHIEEIAELMSMTGEGPDFITIDGGEGGTGAAPVALADHMGEPILHSIPVVDNILRKHGVRNMTTLIASGQIAKGSDVAVAIAMGADMVNIARGNLIGGLGCIMAKRCHTNHCPVGIATQDPRLRRGLDPEDKYVRTANYNMVLQRDLLIILKAIGVRTPWELTRNHISVVTAPLVSTKVSEIYPYPDGSNGKREPLLGEMPPEDHEHLDRFGPKLIQLGEKH